jgi:hypothetical protein
MIGGSYVVAALVFVLAVAGAGITGWHERGKQADAEISAIKSGLEAKVAQAEKRAAETSERVVVRYQDRVKVIHEVPQEVVHEIEVIRQSKCVLPAEWVRLHDAGAGVPSQAPGSADDTAQAISCADAIEVVRENYLRSRENSAELEALQDWIRGVSSGGAVSRPSPATSPSE